MSLIQYEIILKHQKHTIFLFRLWYEPIKNKVYFGNGSDHFSIWKEWSASTMNVIVQERALFYFYFLFRRQLIIEWHIGIFKLLKKSEIPQSYGSNIFYNYAILIEIGFIVSSWPIYKKIHLLQNRSNCKHLFVNWRFSSSLFCAICLSTISWTKM